MATMATMSMGAMNMAAMHGGAAPKREGDISDAFASMAADAVAEPLPERFRQMKLSLSAGHEAELQASWDRLLDTLRAENQTIVSQGTKVVPVVDFANLEADLERLKDEIKLRGVAVIRGVIPEAEARAYKDEIEDYVRKNPHTRGFPQNDRQVFELYWSSPQLKARAHPNLLTASRALLTKFWHGGHSTPPAKIDLTTPISYADRLRIRQPGDASFSLGPHQDGGSVERWEPQGYGLGHVYDPVFSGEWDSAENGFDPWDGGARVAAVTNLYEGLGACSAFRAFQGWVSMSTSGPGEGTLLVYPGMRLATAYALLRPFFRPVRTSEELGGEAFLDKKNWVFTAGEEMTSELQGATPGRGQEFPSAETHPHLELARTMVHVPEVKPGDFVVWHCDTIHAVDPKHDGASDSSVLYIPVCPVTELNAVYLARQRAAFLDGTPGPDFPGGKGESEHVDRPAAELVKQSGGSVGLQAFGLEKLPSPAEDAGAGARTVRERHNAILGF